MCWMKMPSITVPSISAATLQKTATAQDPDGVSYGGSSSWEQTSKKKGVAALTIKKDTLNKATNDTGVNYNFSSEDK